MTSSAAPTVSARQAAVALAALLARSGSDRQQVNDAFNDVDQCGPSLSQDAQTFQASAASHRELLRELATMPGTSALPRAMVRDLTTAWQASASADDDFARWAQDESIDGCSDPQSDQNRVAADQPDVQATHSKEAFVSLWNPMAQAYGLPTYSQGDL